MNITSVYNQELLVKKLLDPNAYDHRTKNFELIETHISWIVLTGYYAYKIKKQLKLSFLDTSNINNRRLLCQREYRINQKFNTDLYIGVNRIIGTMQNPRIEDKDISGDELVKPGTLELAVKMNQFDTIKSLDKIIHSKFNITKETIRLGKNLARIHKLAKLNSNKTRRFPYTQQAVLDNINVLNDLNIIYAGKNRMIDHRIWVKREIDRLSNRFKEREQSKAIRACHGDIHLRNIYLNQNSKLCIFDALEFNDDLRYIDPLSEVSFLFVDLFINQKQILATTLLNSWLEEIGDYSGMDLFRWYSAYRSTVLAKVHAIRSKQIQDRKHLTKSDKNCIKEYESKVKMYLDYAVKMESESQSTLILMHGLSGSGKTFISNFLLKSIPSIRIRSDLERKRIHKMIKLGLTGQYPKISIKEKNIFINKRLSLYDKNYTDWLFNKWIPLIAYRSLSSGLTTILDACFLRRRERSYLIEIAKQLNSSIIILQCHCNDSEAKRRILSRQQMGEDPSDASYEIRLNQKSYIEELNKEEMKYSISVGEDCNLDDLKNKIIDEMKKQRLIKRI
ncbi:AAA family ATPase [Prochlorococcus sp. MIT 1300]|uniref:bifunctional aminoglycoside phosphotransferase/ATP-binding protein n=1 Tax=Prochlorococcus sp. MIT 1300 TaxID=3096218 RepID=UPI002A75F4CE|nr:AAA family ATPase [Prochlorococcus sp. MIT 1300]